jgi:excisionase family DNA binding protein
MAVTASVHIEDDPETRRHLLAAVTAHVRRLQRDGRSVPAGLAMLLVAPDGQGRTPVGEIAESADGGGMTPLALDYRSAGAVLGVSERTTRRLVRAGELPSVNVGGCPRVRMADLVAYVTGLDPVNSTGRQA